MTGYTYDPSPQTAALSAIPVILSEAAPIGAPVYTVRDPWLMTSSAMFIHPLDWIAMQHPNDPYGRLDASMTWIVKRANERLDALEKRLGIS